MFSIRTAKLLLPRLSPLKMSHSATATARLLLTQQHLTVNRCNSTTNSHISPESIGITTQGTQFTADYEVYAVNKSTGNILSWFHDIPLDFNEEQGEANIVVEIPRWSNAKFEISTKLPGNPIVQDVKKGKVRFVRNLFPHHGYISNYGAFPQTWEDPTTKEEELQLFGDNDPLDICEIGTAIIERGSVKRVKILGSLALIDDGELDWKVIVVDINDPLAKEVFDIHDLYTKCPGLLETTRQWFRDYKLADGKPQNKFAFNGKYKDRKETLEIIKNCNRSWRKLVTGEITGDKIPSIENSTLVGTPGYNGGFETQKLIIRERKPDAPIPVEISKSHFIPTD
ncbi:inorganic pyrophosphatase [Scheffersomyces xylosifermentans]|uniref:inorganic pyrophosphatase n=1 Tax=Scheffersomyces xylosifermentans TaxID=1304137 RepID=UPI00315CC1F3